VNEELGLDQQVRILWDTALEGLVLVDDSRRYVHVNEPAAAVFGAPPEVVVGRSIEQHTARHRRSLIEPLWATLQRAGEVEGRGILLRHDGTQTIVEFRARWRFDEDRHLLALRELNPPARARLRSDGQPVPRLTPREGEVLQLAADGRSTREIAAQLVVSPGTVKTHLHHIYAKLKARDRASAVATAMRLGLIA
jgi:PAS domain S-box-containing protein